MLRLHLAKLLPEQTADYGRRHYMLFMYVFHQILGKDWVENNVLLHALGPAKGKIGFFEMDFSADEIRELKSLRIFDLAEILLNLQMIEGFDDCVGRLRSGDQKQIEATYAELQFAKLLYVHDIDFKFVVPAKKVKGEDYDYEIRFPDGTIACADAKCKLEATDIDPHSVKNSLKDARDQLPATKPGIIFVKVPQNWFDVPGMVDDLNKIALDFMRGTGRIVSVKYYISHVTFRDQATLHRHAYKELSNASSRFPARDWNLFTGYHVPKDWNGMPPKWIRLMNFE